jgi:hypothetical protein
MLMSIFANDYSVKRMLFVGAILPRVYHPQGWVMPSAVHKLPP